MEELLPTIEGDPYPTFAPMLRAFAKQLWIQGRAHSLSDIAERVRAVDIRVRRHEVMEWVKLHHNSPEWQEERAIIIDAQYRALMETAPANPIDLQFEDHFSRLANVAGRDLQLIEIGQKQYMDKLEESIADPLQETISPVAFTDAKQLKSLGEVLKTAYHNQRLARNMATENHAHAHAHIVNAANSPEGALTSPQNILAKTRERMKSKSELPKMEVLTPLGADQ